MKHPIFCATGLVCAMSAVTGCGSAPASSPPPAASVASPASSGAAASCDYYDYRFELDAELRTLSAVLCFDGPPPPALVCGPQGDVEYAPVAERISGEGVAQLTTQRCRIPLDSLLPGDCVRYAVDLRTLDGEFPLRRTTEGRDVVTAQVGAFLFRPEVRGVRLHGHATFSVPDGMRVSLPWQRDADGFLLDASVFEQTGYAVFGSFDSEIVVAAGATLDVAILDTLSPTTRAAIVPFVTRAAQTAAQIGGAFPGDRAQLVLAPQPGAGGVRFGMVARGGGASVVFVFGRDSTEGELIESWEPGHELTHLRTPFVTRSDRWLTEGIATYYQEVLRARAGTTTPQHAWKRLVTGLSRGAEVGTGRTLRQESKDMYDSGAFQRVYWAGAAVAFLIDVELRRVTENATSLDTVVSGLQQCCARDARAWTVSDMIARMDQIAGHDVVQRVSGQHLDRAEFPALAETFAALGVMIRGGDVTLDDAAPLKRVRDAIMAPVPSPRVD